MIFAGCVDVLVVMETQHALSSDVAGCRSVDSEPPGYGFLDRSFCTISHGSNIFHKDNLRVRMININFTPTSFEVLAALNGINAWPTGIPRHISTGSASPSSVFIELSLLMKQFAVYSMQLVIAGGLDLLVENQD